MDIYSTDEEQVVLGTDMPVPKGCRYFYSPWQGDSKTVIYEGSREQIETLAGLVAAAGYEASVDYSRPVARLEYEYYDTSSSSSTGETWELRGNDVSKKLASHESLKGFASQIAEIDEVMAGKNKDYQPGTNSDGTNQSAISKYIADRSLDNELIQYIALRTVGGDTYTEAGYRIIYTQITSNDSDVTASMEDVMTVCTPPVPDDAKFSLPTGEWLKKAPQVISLGHGKFKITQEWVWSEEASNLLYGGSWIPSIS